MRISEELAVIANKIAEHTTEIESEYDTKAATKALREIIQEIWQKANKIKFLEDMVERHVVDPLRHKPGCPDGYSVHASDCLNCKVDSTKKTE